VRGAAPRTKAARDNPPLRSAETAADRDRQKKDGKSIRSPKADGGIKSIGRRRPGRNARRNGPNVPPPGCYPLRL